jgi:hypothetical protein
LSYAVEKATYKNKKRLSSCYDRGFLPKRQKHSKQRSRMTIITKVADAIQGIFNNANELAKKPSSFSDSAP